LLLLQCANGGCFISNRTTSHLRLESTANTSAVTPLAWLGLTVLDLSSYLGLGAVGAATLTLWLGLLMALRYSPVRHWPHRHVNLFALHQWAAYATVVFTLTHPVVLLFQHSPRFGVFDLVFPIHSPLQPKLNLAGAGALYLIVLILVTSLLRHRIGRPLWRKLHYLAFPAAALIFLHSILTDPLLRDGHPDLLDGGKVFVEIACLLSAIAIGWRTALRGKGLRAS
jgi:DMSO/TMAO reductase YedYZ heme-binding membrane subunit